MRRWLFFCWLCVLLCTACDPAQVNRIYNTADIGIDRSDTYVLRTEEPLIYHKQNGRIHKLMSDPFFQLDRRDMRNTYVIGAGEDDTVSALLAVSDYTIFSINPSTLANRVDCQLAKGYSPSSFLGLNALLQISGGSSGYVPSVTFALYQHGGKQILVRSSGLFAIRRGGERDEICLCEDSILDGNVAYDGTNVYYRNNQRSLIRFSLDTQKRTVICERVDAFYLTKDTVLLTKINASGIFRLSLADGSCQRFADGRFSAIVPMGDGYYYVNAADHMVYEMDSGGTIKRKVSGRKVTRLGVMDSPPRLVYLDEEGRAFLLGSDGQEVSLLSR